MIPHYFDISYWKKPIPGINKNICIGQKLNNSKENDNDSVEKPNTTSIGKKPLKEDSFSTKEPKKSKRKLEKNSFILDEAIDDDNSFDEDISHEEDSILQDSIITDNETELIDYSHYLKTTKDLIGPSNKYKLKYDYDPNINVYSQPLNVITAECDDYEKDSFCNDEIIYCSESEIEKTPKHIKNGLKQKISSSTPILPKKRRRILMIDESP